MDEVGDDDQVRHFLGIGRVVVLLGETGRARFASWGVIGRVLNRVRVQDRIFRVFVRGSALAVRGTRQGAVAKDVHPTVGYGVVVLLRADLFCLLRGVHFVSFIRCNGALLPNRVTGFVSKRRFRVFMSEESAGAPVMTGPNFAPSSFLYHSFGGAKDATKAVLDYLKDVFRGNRALCVNEVGEDRRARIAGCAVSGSREIIAANR